MPNKRICEICYNKNTNDILKCKQCKNCVCDECYANITFNNVTFMSYFNNDKTLYNCPYCKFENTFSTKINNFNTNNKLIKLVLNKSKNNDIEFNNLVDDLDFLRSTNLKLQTEVYKLQNMNNSLSTKVKSFKLNLEFKPNTADKLEKIENIIKTTKRETKLYNQINYILNK